MHRTLILKMPGYIQRVRLPAEHHYLGIGKIIIIFKTESKIRSVEVFCLLFQPSKQLQSETVSTSALAPNLAEER